LWYFLNIAKQATKGKGMKMYKLELTARQLEAIEAAIFTHSASYDGFSDAELTEWDVKRELLSLIQVQRKIDNLLEKADA
jgi:hypothetical protein